MSGLFTIPESKWTVTDKDNWFLIAGETTIGKLWPSGQHWRFDCRVLMGASFWYLNGTEDEAKAAAEAHYKAEVMKLLEPATQYTLYQKWKEVNSKGSVGLRDQKSGVPWELS